MVRNDQKMTISYRHLTQPCLVSFDAQQTSYATYEPLLFNFDRYPTLLTDQKLVKPTYVEQTGSPSPITVEI